MAPGDGRGGRAVWVGVLLVELAVPWARSLKEKRSVVKPVAERLKTRFPLSVARLDGLDARDRETLGASAISHDPDWLRDVLEGALAFVAASDAEVAWSEIDVERWDA